MNDNNAINDDIFVEGELDRKNTCLVRYLEAEASRRNIPVDFPNIKNPRLRRARPRIRWLAAPQLVSPCAPDRQTTEFLRRRRIESYSSPKISHRNPYSVHSSIRIRGMIASVPHGRSLLRRNFTLKQGSVIKDLACRHWLSSEWFQRRDPCLWTNDCDAYATLRDVRRPAPITVIVLRPPRHRRRPWQVSWRSLLGCRDSLL